MEIIEINVTLEEKLEIAKPILVPKQKRNMVLKGERDFI
jgi:ATP-dependent Lon protease